MGKTRDTGFLTDCVFTDSSNNVGIGGAANASYKLAVTGASLFSSSVTATEGIFSSSGVDGSLGAVVRISTTNTNGNARNWALVNTFENYGDLNFRISTAQGGNALTSGTTAMTLNRSGFLGLATNNPTAKVHIEGQNWTTGSLSDAWNAPFFKLTPRPAATTASIVMTNAGTSSIMAIQSLSGTTTAETLSLNPYGGKVCVNTTATNNGWLSVQGAYGAAAIDARGSAGEWTYYGIASSTSGSSNGLLLYAGTTSADVAVLIKNQSGSSEYFQVRGDGLILSPSTYNVTTASAANMNIGTAGDFRRSAVSSIRFKENIIDWDGNGLDTILALKPKTFTYKEDYYSEPNRQFLGLIAEEVAEVSSYLADFENEDGSGQVENVRYANIVVPLIKAVQELSAKVTALENR